MIQRLAIRLLAASSLATLLVPAAMAATKSAPPPAAGTVTTQLPRNAVPAHYRITVTPDAANLKFTGKTSIDVTLLEPSKSVTLNAADLTFAKAGIRRGKGKLTPATVATNADAQTATLTFAKAMKAGKYTIEIEYAGKIYQQANGLFALD
jgi:aminopeptidase N